MGASLVVNFCEKSQILRTKNTCLFEQPSWCTFCKYQKKQLIKLILNQIKTKD